MNNKEDILTRLESLKKPEIILESHHQQLKKALLDSGVNNQFSHIAKIHSIPKLAWVSVPVVALIVAAIVFQPWGLFEKSHFTIYALAEKSQTKADEIVSNLIPGKALYWVEEYYWAPNQSSPNSQFAKDFGFPESYVANDWSVVDSQGKFFISIQALVKDLNGKPIFQERTVNGIVMLKNLLTGQEIIDNQEFPRGLSPLYIDVFVHSNSDIPLSINWTFVGKGQWEGQETTIYEQKIGNPIERMEIVNDNPLLKIIQYYTIGDDGTRVLSKEIKIHAFEVVDTSSLPVAQ